jgi:hypothetical protein
LLLIGFCPALSQYGWAGARVAAGKSADSYVQRYRALPLSFEANHGQVDPEVKFLARGGGYTLFLTSSATVLGLRGEGKAAETHWVRLVLQGADANAAVSGEQELTTRNNYFVGADSSKWQNGVPTYSKVRYRKIYPGVDLIYHGGQGQLENDFEIDPGADASVVRWNVEGARAIRVDQEGNLVIAAGENNVCLRAPRAYQSENGREREVAVRFTVDAGVVGFRLGSYNHRDKLIIDPVLTYSTFLGSTGGETAYGVALDTAGNVYVTGVTASTNFPFTAGVFQTTYAGDGDVFVSEFNPSATGLIFSTFLGGTGDDVPAQIVLGSSGNIYLVGSTTSNNFPTTPGVMQTAYAGNQDAFLTEMKSDGSGLVYSTYIGGTGTDFGTAMALDTSGNAYVVGSTNSTDLQTRNPLQLSNVGQYDAYVTEVSPTGALLYCTYLGGALNDYGTGIAVDASGNVILSGYTFSTDFPTQQAFQSGLAGGSDLFISKFAPGSTALLFSTYLGGASIDRSWAMTTDANGSIYLTGDTQSLNFPVTPNAYQPALTGTDNPFLTKIDSTGSTLVFSTYLGGGSTGMASAIAVDAAGNSYLTGTTQSADLPLIDPFQNILGLSGAGNCGSTNLITVIGTVCPDAFVAKFGPSGIPVFASFLGGSGTDAGQGIAVDPSGAIYVVGGTASPNFPVSFGTYQWRYLGVDSNTNAFLTKISLADSPSLAVTPQIINFGNQPLQIATQPTTINLTNLGSAVLNISSITAAGDFSETNNCGGGLPAGGAGCTIQVTFNPSSVGLKTEQIIINDNSGTGSQGITVTGTGVESGGSLEFNPTTLTFAAQTVGTSSGAQTALLVNNGNRPVTISNINLLSNDFSQTNNCGPNFPTVPATLNVGQSCTVSATFTPTASGTLTGAISVASDAVNQSTNLSLSGTGSSVFTLAASSRSTVVTIGAKAAQFQISVQGPNTLLLNPVTLTCSGGVTCEFSQSSVPVGQSSTITVTGLTSTSANPLNFTVTGKTASGQSATIALTIFFADYTLTATPSGTSVKSGSNATYTISVNPINGFNEPVLLSCPPGFPGIPVGTTCYWNPPSVVPSGVVGSTVTSTLTITTLAESKGIPHGPRGIPPGWNRGILLLALLIFAGAVIISLTRNKYSMRPQVRLAILVAAALFVALAAGCEDYVNPININPVVNGTPAGSYTIQLTGTLGDGSGVTRTTNINLSVVP